MDNYAMYHLFANTQPIPYYTVDAWEARDSQHKSVLR